MATTHSAYRRPSTRHHDPHDDAVFEAEVHLLVEKLSHYGALPREGLAREAKASLWHQGSFEGALKLAIDQGAIVRLPNGCLTLPDHT